MQKEQQQQQREQPSEKVEPPNQCQSLPENEKKNQRALLIKALGRFRPEDATPLQFYNCVREACIMHNCSIDEGLERAVINWPKLSTRQRNLYDSQRHAELPIPVPRHLVYRAFEKERNGLWTLGRSAASTNGSTSYTVEAYKPTPNPSKLRAQLNAKKPKYDNMRTLSPKSAATQSLPPQNVRVSPASGRRIRTLMPPPQLPMSVANVQVSGSNASKGRILSTVSIAQKTLRKRRRLKKITHKSGTVITPKRWSLSSSGNNANANKTTENSSMKHKKKQKSKKTVKKSIKTDQKSSVKTNWQLAIGGVRQNLKKKTL
ncbi:uncharacterized protein LOC117588276 [Drosophila guanche]|uniref:Uncharacterized protein n=1 Tax=Drosophila guanche TaxID=7266 RepID=A0A3B0JXM2_DROGU|nr:uncharacterized protein LOC117588276 [Drosophila guanche]SPP86815.1 Hypothetical predicted protein [Drosophila guanche]